MLAAVAALALSSAQTFAQQSGTTLAAAKTIQICNEENANGKWTIYGEISVWNAGVVATSGLSISDVIQIKVGSKFLPLCIPVIDFVPGTEIAAGTTLETATTFKYVGEIEPGSVLPTDIVKNTATITILNHSGSLGKAKGPSPSATWSGVFDCPQVGCTCTYSQGYWGDKPGVIWPAGYDRNAPFFNSGLTWQNMLDASGGGNGYYILARQYIAATLNIANGSCAPDGIFGANGIYNLATAWFNSVTTPELACPLNSACGTQKAWNTILKDYIIGDYPGSPGHCGDEEALP